MMNVNENRQTATHEKGRVEERVELIKVKGESAALLVFGRCELCVLGRK